MGSKKSPTPYRKVEVNARDLAGCCGGGHDHRNRWSHHRNEWSRCRNQKNQIENIGWSRSPESVVTIIGIRTQAIPGQVNAQWIQADAPGVYRGQCAAFCGAQHAHMGFEVVAQPPAQFDAWREAQSRQAQAPTDALARTGRAFFMKRCAGCHAVRGSDADGTFGPDLTHLGSRRRIAAGMLANTPEQVLEWVRRAQDSGRWRNSPSKASAPPRRGRSPDYQRPPGPLPKRARSETPFREHGQES
ncbi:c-type cytochrome [Castellaniella sp. S9]|uniref:c-type cytochrome n=1 Tax=Castellaniella sp. S9 TaxID=2993652 RepID=UPI002F96C6EC